VLALRYQQTSADLARLRTSDPSSPLVTRLNDLVAQGHGLLGQRPRHGSLRGVLAFLWVEYPALVGEIRRFVAAAALVEIAISVIGFLWAWHDPASAASFLPTGLRDAGHRTHPPLPAALMAPDAVQIFVNNIYVSLMSLAGGVTLGALTAYSTYLNFMLLGVLSGVTNRQGLDGEYWSLILPHGVLELSAITICAAAGLSLAAAVIHGTQTPRATAIRRAGTRAAMIGVGTAPILVVAGTIEGFVTPSGLPIPVKLAVAPVSGLLLYAYLGRRGRRGAT